MSRSSVQQTSTDSRERLEALVEIARRAQVARDARQLVAQAALGLEARGGAADQLEDALDVSELLSLGLQLVDLSGIG